MRFFFQMALKTTLLAIQKEYKYYYASLVIGKI